MTDALAPDGFSIAAVMVFPFVAAAEARGADSAALLNGVGIDPSTLSQPLARLPRDKVYAFVDSVLDATGDPDLGLHAAEIATSERGRFGIVEFLVGSSASNSDAIDKISRFSSATPRRSRGIAARRRKRRRVAPRKSKHDQASSRLERDDRGRLLLARAAFHQLSRWSEGWQHRDSVRASRAP